jgi:membrane protease YdiL (CAAX protease family)
MPAFAVFISLFVIGFACMALFAWPMYEWLAPNFEVEFHRVANRLGMLVLFLGFILVARRMRLADRASLGYGLPRKQFLRETAIGLALGVATMLPIALLMFALDLRELRPQLAIDASGLLRLAVSGPARGIAVALIEETLIRGVMHTGIARTAGVRAAILLTSLLYAAVHFLGRYRIPPEELGPDSGLRHVLGSLAAFATPRDIVDAFLALFAVGVLLGVVRHLTGNIAACLGLHAGWVWIITLLRESSQPRVQHPWAMLLSEFDGVVGWLLIAWTVVIGSVLWWYYARVSPPLRLHDESSAR